MVRVRLSGGLALERDGVPVDLPRSRRGRALLAWLALHPGMHARGQLAGRFWPDVLESSARTSLRAALTELRGALGPDAGCLVATREAVGLVGDGLTVDVREFAERIAAGDPKGAVAACGGDLLSGMDEDWVHVARAEHAERAGEALTLLALRAEAHGDARAAVTHARAAAALDPLAEERHRELMRLLAAAGDRAAALTTYEQLAERLRVNVGIAPSAETRALAAQLRDGPADAPAASVAIPAPAPVARAADQQFVGRARELTELESLLQAATARRERRLVTITGEPGIGKTRLALRFAARAHAAGAAVVLGRCPEESLRAYAPFADVIAHVGGAVGADALGRLGGPDLAALTVGAPDASVVADAPGAVARERLFDAVDSLLTALAARPLVLVLDDLHWADAGTLQMLATVLGSVRPAPILVCATARVSADGTVLGLGDLLTAMRREAATDRIALGGLGVEEIEALARDKVGSRDAAQLAAAVHRRSGGNAFFATELLRAPAGAPVPDSVRESVRTHRAGLGPEATTLLDLAAVRGNRSDLRTLAAASDLPADMVEAAFEALVGAHLLRADAADVEFPHALVRDAVHDDLNPIRRQRLHRRVADALVAAGGDEGHVEEIAHHLLAAGEPSAALPYLERAADRAMTMAAYEQAASLWLRAADTDESRRGALLASAGEALLRAGDPTVAAAHLAEASAIARRTGDAALLGRAAVARCGLGVEIVEIDAERVELLEEALGVAGADADPALRSALLARLAVELYYAPSRNRSEALSAEAVVAARRSGDPRALAAALNARHVALWRPDRLDERRRVADEMIAAARSARDPALELQGRNWRVVDLFEAGEIDAWRAEVARYGRFARDLRLPVFAWYETIWNAVDAMHRGDFERGVALSEQAEREAAAAGDRNAELFPLMLDFERRAMIRNFDGIDLDWLADRVESRFVGTAYRSGYAWVLAESGRLEEAREQLAILRDRRFALLPFDTNWMSAIAESMEAAWIVGDADTAAVVYDVLQPYAGRQVAAGRAIVTHGAADRQLGYAAALLGRREEAIAHLEAAVRIDAAAGFLPWAERARTALAAV